MMIDETMQMPAEQGITPDSWVIVEVNHEGERFQKILSGWSGSYLYGDSWRLSSQIKEINIDIDSDKIGVAGNSLGGAKSGWVMALDERVKLALVSGWTFDDSLLTYGKFCTRIPNQRLRAICTWEDYISLAQPHCAVLVLNGDADVVIDKEGDGHLWKKTRQLIDRLKSVFWDKKTNLAMPADKSLADSNDSAKRCWCLELGLNRSTTTSIVCFL